MSHTPGPWKATGTKALGLSEVIAPSADFQGGHLVCSVNLRWYSQGSGRGTYLPKEQVEANARLIAAGPDLLEACRMAVDELAALEANYCDALGIDQKINGVALLIEDAIAAATPTTKATDHSV